MLSLLTTILLWLFVSGLVGYLLGSIPTAYLMVKWKSNVDIREAGSGNVGGLNSYKVSGSKIVGLVVVLVDVAKGMAAIMLVENLVGQAFIYLAAAGIGAVLGHNFPVWLRFKGGRGISTAGGVLLIFSWQLAVLWTLLWAIGFFMTRRVNVGNVFASVLMLIIVLAAPAAFLRQFIVSDVVVLHFKYFAVLLVGMILIKHIDPMQEYFNERKTLREQSGGSDDAGS
jgi:glycerol-3-phosphate acyltransferase PlsY